MERRKKTSEHTVFGDFQTPLDLAREVTAFVARAFPPPAAVVEPTCGRGAFLLAAKELFPSAALIGFDTNAAYVKEAKGALGAGARVKVRDFFDVAWGKEIARLPKPVIVLGNPPWVTNSALGRLGGANLPVKKNDRGDSGLRALTGASNFDISEWMLRALVHAGLPHGARIVMLCKSAVARKMVSYVTEEALAVAGSLHTIDSQKAFGASVDAVVLSMWAAAEGAAAGAFAMHASLDDPASRTMAVVGGTLTANLQAFDETRHLAKEKGDPNEIVWRSGVKHDAAKVMELEVTNAGLRNGRGEEVEVEVDRVYPFLKGSDVANGRAAGRRALVVPQISLSDDTSTLETQAPRLHAYLAQNAAALAARKSRVYEGRSPFAIFGIGPYSFAPYKVAICGLYKRLAFRLVGPHEGRPVVFDDTVTFLAFDTQEEAARVMFALESAPARDFFEARVFWDAKRPLGKALLASLSITRLMRHLGIVWSAPAPLPRAARKNAALRRVEGSVTPLQSGLSR